MTLWESLLEPLREQGHDAIVRTIRTKIAEVKEHKRSAERDERSTTRSTGGRARAAIGRAKRSIERLTSRAGGSPEAKVPR